MQDEYTTELRIKDGFMGQKMIVLPKKVKQEAKNNPLVQNLFLTDVGFFPRARHHFRERKSGGKEFILIYCIEGNGIIEVFNQRHKVSPNTFYIIPPKAPHSYKAVANDPWSIYWLHFRGAHAAHIYNRFCINGRPVVRDAPFDGKRVALFDNIISILEEGYSADRLEYVNLTLWQIFTSFIFYDRLNVIGGSLNKDDIAGRAIRYMKNNLDRNLTIEEVANGVNCSGSHFFALFKKRTGCSPIQYFNQLKIQKGCQYLSFTDLSVKELSSKIGFNDPFYFSRLFRKTMGISPQEYRNKYRE